jgi:hypothetical protein
MPYQKNPAYNTNSTQRFNLNFDIEDTFSYRTTGYAVPDAYIENAIVEHVHKDEDNPQTVVKSRPGQSLITNIVGSITRGAFYWGANSNVYYVVDNKIYSKNTGTTILGTLAYSTGQIGWTEFLYANGTTVLILTDGQFLYKITTTNVITSSQPTNMPLPHLPNPIVIDGYLFLAAVNSNNIYNANLDDPLTWTAGNYISAEMYPDTIQALSKNNNYLYAIGGSSIEFFYDNGTTNTSPLARYANAVLQIGLPPNLSNCVVQTEREVLFVGTQNNGSFSIWSIDGFKPTELSTPAISRVITSLYSLGYATGISAFCLNIEGHKMYFINFPGWGNLVYDFDCKLWYKWSNNNDSSINTQSMFGYYGVDSGVGSYYTVAYGGAISIYQATSTTDINTTYTTNVITSEMDFDTFNYKTMSKLTLIGREDTFGNSNTVSISWSDNNDTFITPVSIPGMFSILNKASSIYRLGTFRRRRFKFSLDNAAPWIIYGVEVNINKGSS